MFNLKKKKTPLKDLAGSDGKCRKMFYFGQLVTKTGHMLAAIDENNIWSFCMALIFYTVIESIKYIMHGK